MIPIFRALLPSPAAHILLTVAYTRALNIQTSRARNEALTNRGFLLPDTTAAAGERKTYQYSIIPDHTAGSYWYVSLLHRTDMVGLSLPAVKHGP